MRDMIAVGTGSKIKALGYLTWFSVPDEPVALRTLKRTLAVHGLPPTLAPKDTKAIHTFKRAMREQDGRHRLEDGTTRENEVALVRETGDDCVMQISTLVRNDEEQVVDYPKGLRVIFNKRDEVIRFNVLGEVRRSELLPIMEAITEFYEKNGAKVTGARVRGVVRNYLKNTPDEQRDIDGLGGENLRGKAGGIYFVPAKHGEQLQALAEMLAELYHGRAYLHHIPLADSASEREIIRRHHIANTRAEMKEAISEVKGLLSGDRERKVRSDVIAAQWSRFHALNRRSAEYAGLLEDEQEEIGDMAKILKRQLDNLID